MRVELEADGFSCSSHHRPDPSLRSDDRAPVRPLTAAPLPISPASFRPRSIVFHRSTRDPNIAPALDRRTTSPIRMPYSLHQSRILPRRHGLKSYQDELVALG